MPSVSTGIAVLLLAQFSAPAPAAVTSVLSGASYQAVVAPQSWAVVFGAALARSTATATRDATTGQWPTQLAGTSVQVNGQAAELYYVSPTQINFLVPGGTTFGSLSLVITDVGSGATQSAAMQVQNTAPGIFTSDSSGSGPGAILNAVTYAAAPFLVETPENGGSDLRTRLAVYGAGLRYAGNPTQDPTVTDVSASVTAQGQDTAGNRYTFTVEYAGAAPGFPGLDQVNIVLPVQLDGAGVVSLTLAALGAASNVVTFAVNALPASSIRLTGLALSSSEITAGNGVTGTVSLNGQAKAGGFPVSLRSSLATLSVPPLVTVPQGQASTTFTFTPSSAATAQTATLTATAGAAAETATLLIDPANQAQLGGFTVSPSTVQGGAALTGTLSLTAPATFGAVPIQLSSDDTAVQLPASVTVPFNTSSTTFPITTSVVTAPQTANLTATLGQTSLMAQVTLLPALQLTLSANAVTGGGSVTATVTLGKAAPASGANLTVQSNDTLVAQASGLATISSGQTTTAFTITTSTVTAAHTVTITVTYAALGLSQSATLTVNPQAAGQLQSVTVSPTKVTGGASATGTITLTGPAQFGGLFVQLSSSNLFAAAVPQLVNVPQGQTTATFTVSTSRVVSTQTVTLTATAGGITETAVLTVN